MKNKEHDSKQRFHFLENLFVAFLALIILFGIVCDVVAKTGNSRWIIPDLRDFSMNVLQIQAGVSSLSIAVLALITGMIDKEIYGINITQYYMRIRPHIFKQHYIIISTLSLVFLGVIFESLKLYNLVFAVFFSEWLLIIISVISIMPVFDGNRKWEKEIFSYLSDNIENESVPNHDLIVQFLDSCKNSVERNDWEKREILLWKSLNSLIKDNKEESFEIINGEWCKMISGHLCHNESWVIKRGLRLLQTTYEKIWKYLLEPKDKSIGSSGTPELVDVLYEDIMSTCDHISLNDLEECFRFDLFFEFASRANSYYLINHQDLFENKCKNIEWLYGYIAHLIDKKTIDTPLSDGDKRYFGKIIVDPFIGDYNIPEESKSIFMMHRCRAYIKYTIGLINDGYSELIEEYYLETPSYTIQSSRYQILYRLAIACYLYYVAEVENEYLVPKKIRNCAQRIIGTSKFKSQFTTLLHNNNWEKERDFYKNDCAKVLEQLLMPYEIYRNGQFKNIVIEPTTQIFYIFIQCYIAKHRYIKPIESDNIDDLKSIIINYLTDNQRELTKDKFISLYKALIIPHHGLNPVDRANELFYKWEKRTIEKFKEVKIKYAFQSNESFNDNNIEKELTKYFKEHILVHFNKQLSPIFDQALSNGHLQHFDLVSLAENTDYLADKKFLNNYDDVITGEFIDHLIEYLQRINSIELYDRSEEFDSIFWKDIKNENIDLIIGREYQLQPKNIRNWNAYTDIIKKYDCIFSGYAKSTMAIQNGSIKIAVRNINVSVQDIELSDYSGADFIKEMGLYRISLINGIAGLFTKEEAESYIKNQKKLISISVDVAISTSDEHIGFKVIR